MKKNYKKINLISLSLISIFILVFISACVSMPKKLETLERAQIAYEQAKANQEIVANARVAMHDAEKAIQNALKAYRAEDENVKHLSYIAERQVQIAVAKAEQRIAEKKIDFLSKHKQKVLLESRQKEAEMALKRAEEKEREVEAKAKELELKQKEVQLANEQKRHLEKELSDLQARHTERGIQMTLGGDVLFKHAQSVLSLAAMRYVDKIAHFLNRNPGRNVIIEGHTDGKGPDKYNEVLSKQRADNVRMALIERDVNPRRIITKGYGELYPVAGNNTPEGRELNRRVEVIILNEGEGGRSMFNMR